MRSLWDQFIREPLRKVLMRILIFTEKKSSEQAVLNRQGSILLNDIHIPPVLVAMGAASFLLVVSILGVGWSWHALAGMFIFVSLTLVLFVFYLKHDLPVMMADDEAIMLIGTLMVLFVAITSAMRSWTLSFYLTPLPAAAVLAALLLHPRLSIILATMLAMINGIMHGFSFDCFFVSFFGCMGGTASAIYVRTHKDFIRVGAVVSALHIAALSFLMIFRRDPVDAFWWNALWSVSNGFLSSVLALGLLPFLESFFLRVTPMKLLELADFNQPLLKRLMVEAPGTYHHSLMMANIAEAAAHAVGANTLLCRVGAYYHDIGKLVKPEYFIENQGELPRNPHGKLAPALSSLVVISHVKEGVALARAAKLPQEIIDFIPMHHGTSRIEYFYRQAVEEAQDDFLENLSSPNPENVGEEVYRYPGPKPMTKETAILMISDSVEAAARTIDEPTHERFQDLSERIVKTKFEDGQLSKSTLTLADLSRIEEAIAATLTSIYHERIKYPEDPARNDR